MDELLTSLGLCLISMFLKMKLYSQKDLSILGVFIWITEIYLLVKAEWGWDDKIGAVIRARVVVQQGTLLCPHLL